MKKISYLLLIGIYLLLNMFICCTNEDPSTLVNNIEDNGEYLTIDNIVQRTSESEKIQLNNEEKIILYKTFSRIFDNSQNEQGKIDMTRLSASDLNIEEHLFVLVLDFLSPYIKGEKIIGASNNAGYFPRVKTRTESGGFDGGYVGGGGGLAGGGGFGGFGGFGGGGDGSSISGGTHNDGSGLNEIELKNWFKNKFTKDEVYKMICEQADLSTFEQKCLKQYWYAKGQMIISREDWLGIKAVTDTTNYKTGKIVFKEEMKFYKKTVSFYSCPEYDYALGSSTIFFTEKGKPVGLRDSYDFNMFANRSLKAEAATITMSVLGALYGGQNYEIYYGIY